MEKDKDLIFEEKLNGIKDENNEVELGAFLNFMKDELKEESDKLDEELAKELDGVDVANEIRKMFND